MREVMLRPGWPGTFRRTVKAGRKSRLLVFEPNAPVEVSPEEFRGLAGDLGLALFEVERDEKGRPRCVESAEADDTSAEGEAEPELQTA